MTVLLEQSSERALIVCNKLLLLIHNPISRVVSNAL